MLLADVFRGKHATGVMRVAHNGQAMSVQHAKLAMSSKYFLDLPVYDLITGISQSLTILAGHNRHATKGASDNHKFAHPFKHGHITLMHNGSLTSHYNLTRGTSETFTVDSEAICFAMSRGEAHEVIPQLNGAFALVWVDEEKQTLNFVRNSERPLHLAFDERLGKIYWASEKDMLKWLLDRDMTMASGGFRYDRTEELPVGEIWSFPINQNSVDLKGCEVTSVEVSKPFTYTGYGNYVGGTNTKKSQGANNASASANKTSVTTGNSNTGSVNKTTGTSTTGNSSTGIPCHAAVDNSVGTEYLLTPSLETTLKASSSKVLDHLGRQQIGVRSYINAADQQATELDKRIPFFIKSFAVYPSSVNKEPEKILGCLKGKMVEYPFSDIIIHACTKMKFDELVAEGNSIGSSYIQGIKAEDTAKQLGKLSDSQAKLLFDVVLRGDTIKQVEEVTNYLFDMNEIPSSWKVSQEPEVVKGIELVVEQEKELAQKK